MTDSSLTLILAALAAFFTLITGLATVLAGWVTFYFKRLKDEREEEIKKLGELQNELSKKIIEAEGIKEGGTAQLEEIKRDYQDLKNRFYSISGPQGYTGYAAGGGGGGYYAGGYGGNISIKDLQAQISALMAQLQDLQQNNK